MILRISYIFFFIFLSFPILSGTLSIEGNKKLSYENIQQLSEIDIFSNQLNDNEINKLISDLYQSELISNLSLNINGDSYILKIIENSSINEIYINGNTYINDNDILPILFSKKNSLLNKNNISNDIDILKNLYASKGFNQISIFTVTEQFSEDRVNLIFDITEGNSSYLSNIKFKGNSFFSENYLLSKLNSKTKSFFNIFNNSSNLSKELFNFDADIIKNLYLNKGFFDVKVNYVLKKNNFNSYNIVFYVEENSRYKIDKIFYDDYLKSSDFKFLESNFKKFTDIIKKNKSYFDKKIINNHVIELNKTIFDNNLVNLKISPTYVLDDNSLDLTFNHIFSKTEIINKININGNQITKDNVIRSKLTIEPGDLYVEELVEREMNTLKNYRYINDATYTFSIDNNSDLIIDLDENTKTGNFFFAATASSDLGPGINIGANDYNFLGSGNQINADFNINTENIIFDLNFLHYPHLSSNLRNSYSVSNIESDYTSSFGFKTKEQILSVGVIFDYSENVSIGGKISYQSIKGHSPKFSNDSAVIENIGLFNDVILNYSINYDSRNDILYPSNGSFNSISLSYSPQNLSDNSYLKSTFINKNYFKINDEGSFIFNSNNFGIIESLNSNNIKTFNSYNLGGSSFTGFDYKGIGPRNSNNIYLGGNKFFTSRIGVGTNFLTNQQDNLYFKFFLTAGSIWDSDYSSSKYKLRTSFGSSLDFLTPIGPISISYSLPIQKSDNDILRSVDFRIGGIF